MFVVTRDFNDEILSKTVPGSCGFAVIDRQLWNVGIFVCSTESRRPRVTEVVLLYN